MIELDRIKKVFNAGRPNEFTAVNGVSLSIESEKITVLKGPSGSGKTTLLSIIGCMSRPTARTFSYGGTEKDIRVCIPAVQSHQGYFCY